MNEPGEGQGRRRRIIFVGLSVYAVFAFLALFVSNLPIVTALLAIAVFILPWTSVLVSVAKKATVGSEWTPKSENPRHHGESRDDEDFPSADY